ncbi:hypothetical protein JDV02_001830 [Purpureocillium takamizusanense]|uniref:Uncharacterized protein n=1 Tax=Purpureocillium takamizusanense TaxID=2060973 RepID=A0A9Q8V7Z8_9HYPO|nr:uncharacterized protein JDV02_001830 [Purpureocillium takamizusanense]UNI15287.1 hypothetical protein JDV02_001830 [Purpureocillium takamizusanense]
MEGDAGGDGQASGSQRRDGKRVARDTDGSQDKGHGRNDEPSGSDRSLSERLRTSGKMALHAMSSGGDGMPSTMSDQKSADASGLGSGSATRLSQTIAEASSASSSQGAAQPHHSASFRTHSHSGDAAAAFDTFMGVPNHKSRLPATGQREHVGAPVTQHPMAVPGQQRTVAQQEATDGIEVVQLLSMPDYEADVAVWAEGEDDDALSPAEEARLREALFVGETADRRAHWDRLLNFRPDSAGPADMLQLLGTAETSAADGIWLQHWSDVLSAYNDEVWGDLGPLAAEAKHEVDRLSILDAKGLDQGQTTALNRLQQILAHVRGST